jgi:hypothetical protein
LRGSNEIQTGIDAVNPYFQAVKTPVYPGKALFDAGKADLHIVHVELKTFHPLLQTIHLLIDAAKQI